MGSPEPFDTDLVRFHSKICCPSMLSLLRKTIAGSRASTTVAPGDGPPGGSDQRCHRRPCASTYGKAGEPAPVHQHLFRHARVRQIVRTTRSLPIAQNRLAGHGCSWPTSASATTKSARQCATWNCKPLRLLCGSVPTSNPGAPGSSPPVSWAQTRYSRASGRRSVLAGKHERRNLSRGSGLEFAYGRILRD